MTATPTDQAVASDRPLMEPVTLGAEQIREELHEAGEEFHGLSPREVEYICGMPDTVLNLAAQEAANNDAFYEQFNSVRSDAIRRLARAVPRTWTFFGHYDDSGELVVDHAVEGEHGDVYPDLGQHGGGLWCAAGSGVTLELAEHAARDAD